MTESAQGDEVDPLAVPDFEAQQHKLRGWGGTEDHDLSDDQAAALQERPEPIAQGNFGEALSGDLGRAEVASETQPTPETTEPDTSLGHEGGDGRA